jgi:hypothetical protein
MWWKGWYGDCLLWKSDFNRKNKWRDYKVKDMRCSEDAGSLRMARQGPEEPLISGPLGIYMKLKKCSGLFNG